MTNKSSRENDWVEVLVTPRHRSAKYIQLATCRVIQATEYSAAEQDLRPLLCRFTVLAVAAQTSSSSFGRKFFYDLSVYIEDYILYRYLHSSFHSCRGQATLGKLNLAVCDSGVDGPTPYS